MEDKLILSTIDPDQLAQACADLSSDKILKRVEALLDRKEKEKKYPVYIKPSQVKGLFNIGKDSIYRLIKEGRLTPYYPTSDCLIKTEELLELIEKSKIEQPQTLKKIS